MEFIPVKTRVLIPPQDDLFVVLDEYVNDVKEGDVILISSKVLAIHQGRCILATESSKKGLVQEEADIVIDRDYWGTPLTVKHHTFLGAAGVDESNGNGYLVLLPEHIFESAKEIHTYLLEKYEIENLGVIITDSHSQPFRYGATGVAIGFWGIEPVQNHVGRKDLFGRPIQIEKSNVIDGLTAGAAVIGGEVNECTPVVIARGVPNLTFTNENRKDALFVSPKEDMFRVLYDRFL